MYCQKEARSLCQQPALAMESAALIDQSVSLDLSVGPHRYHDAASRSGCLEAELNRLSEENKRLNDMLNTVRVNYNTLHGCMLDLMSLPKSPKASLPPTTKKRKSISLERTTYSEAANNKISKTDSFIENISSEDSCMRLIKEEPKSKVSRVCVRTDPSDSSLVVKDGYQWRKYGQKFTRDNPSPRAYYKCSFAPSCPVKKKVQRSVEDRSILVAIYEGEHNHDHHRQGEIVSNCSSHIGSLPCSVSVNPSGPLITLDLTQSASHPLEFKEFESPEFHRLLADQMASSLTRDLSFTTALASEISGRIFQVPSAQN